MKKTVLITGIQGNLGSAVANVFATAGYKVAGTVVPGENIRVANLQNETSVFTVDLRDESASAKMIDEIISANGSIHDAILTVGGFTMNAVVDADTDSIRQQFELNFITAYNVARPVFKHMLQQGNGRIFLIGSRPGKDMKNGKGMAAYALSKSLLFNLAQLMNDEANGTDVFVSVVVPTTIDTPQNRAAMPDADFSTWVKAEAIAEAMLQSKGERLIEF